jgi:hypothetical protein
MDFFDGHHQVVVCYTFQVCLISTDSLSQLGGSYATIPRIAERRSFRNWYQRNYSYPWIGARVAYDMKK